MQLSSKYDDSSHYYNVIITQYKLKIDKLGDFSSDIDYNRKRNIFRDVIYLIINVSLGSQNTPLADKVSVSRAAQARESCLFCLNLIEYLLTFSIHLIDLFPHMS